MLTDVLDKAITDLDKAITDIEYYQSTYPRYYDPVKPEIKHIKASMKALGQKLDNPEDPADAQEKHAP